MAKIEMKWKKDFPFQNATVNKVPYEMPFISLFSKPHLLASYLKHPGQGDARRRMPKNYMQESRQGSVSAL